MGVKVIGVVCYYDNEWVGGRWLGRIELLNVFIC